MADLKWQLANSLTIIMLTSEPDGLTANTDIFVMLAVVDTNAHVSAARAINQTCCTESTVDVVQPNWTGSRSHWVTCAEALIEWYGS